VPLREWIIRARLEQARRQLATGTLLPVGTVARRCGFTNVTHFARRFRDTYGIPPGEWQRQFVGRS
jgi:AraC-like DNA-binding protein